MARNEFDLYRGFGLSKEEKRSLAEKLAKGRSISYRSAQRAIQRAFNEGSQQTKLPGRDFQNLVQEVLDENRNEPVYIDQGDDGYFDDDPEDYEYYYSEEFDPDEDYGEADGS